MSVMTPKQIANKIKAKGLQKLRWYCSMCQKQCRDANGFKCHMESESHQRNMLLYAEKAGKFTDDFSRQFETGMMDIIKRVYRSKRVHANVVYNEYIKDRDHIHMNATRWTTLTGFVTYLGKSGKCKVEETPKGWYITYIEKDPELLARQEREAKKERMNLDDEERMRREVERRVKFSQEQTKAEESAKFTGLQRTDEPIKIGFSLKSNAKSSAQVKKAFGPEEEKIEKIDSIAIGNTEDEEEVPEINEDPDEMNQHYEDDDEEDGEEEEKNEKEKVTEEISEKTSVSEQKETPAVTTSTTSTAVPEKTIAPTSIPPPVSSSSSSTPTSKWDKQTLPSSSTSSSKNGSTSSSKDDKKRKLSSMEEIIAAEEKIKDKKNRKDYWLVENIVVKIMNKKLADGKYYKQKGVIKKVFDKYVGLVRMVDSGDVLKIDQEQLETVLPSFGGRVAIVNGAYRGEEGTLLSINEKAFKGQVKIETGSHIGIVKDLDYEDICKLNQK